MNRLRDGGKNSNLSLRRGDENEPPLFLSLSFSVVLEKTIDIEARFSKEDFRYDGRKEEEISSRGNIFPTRQKMGKEEEKSGKKWSNKAWPNNKYLRREETARGGFSRRPTILRTFYDLAYECARLRDFFTVSRSSESFPACCLGEPSTVPFFPPVKCALSLLAKSTPRRLLKFLINGEQKKGESQY